jgi:integrase
MLKVRSQSPISRTRRPAPSAGRLVVTRPDASVCDAWRSAKASGAARAPLRHMGSGVRAFRGSCVPAWLSLRPPAAQQGMRYPADLSAVEEILVVMRNAPMPSRLARATDHRRLWLAGLRITEALAQAEPDLDPRRGSVFVRYGKSGRRREVGMDVGLGAAPAMADRTRRLAGRTAVLHHRGRDSRATVVRRRRQSGASRAAYRRSSATTRPVRVSAVGTRVRSRPASQTLRGPRKAGCRAHSP